MLGVLGATGGVGLVVRAGAGRLARIAWTDNSSWVGARAGAMAKALVATAFGVLAALDMARELLFLVNRPIRLKLWLASTTDSTCL